MAANATPRLKLSAQTSLYNHSTNLSNRNEAIFEIASLKVPRLLLRLPTQHDADALLRLFSDPRNVQYDKSCDGLDNPDAINNLVRRWRNIGHPLERANVVVVVDGKTIGVGGLGWIGKRKADEKVYADAGIMLSPDVRRQGFAYEALCMIIDHGLRILDLEEVQVACVDANIAFKGLMNDKFRFEPTPIQDKQFGNEWIWRITKEQWHDSEHSAEGRERASLRAQLT